MGYTTTPSGLIVPTQTSKTDSAKPNNVAKIGSVSMWARNGFVCMSKELPDGAEDFKQTSVAGARARLRALGELTKSLRRSEKPDYDEIRGNESFMNALEQVIRQAEEQGPYEYEDMRRARVRSRAVSVSVPNFETGN